MTLGGGMIVGGILGAVGAGSLARGHNLARGEAEPVVRWSLEFFQCLVRLALLRYLAVAHFGRGRGDYQESEYPEYWQSAVAETVGRHEGAIRRAWEGARPGYAAVTSAAMKTTLTDTAGELLVRFYPEAERLFSKRGEPTRAARPAKF
jgi:hypothetical protein